ncbi:hypothetical protein [Paenibacillus pini]|uniref:Uncharacterized protein n=1 Tax=Paenibacillus pini JCM 16418 TaxID=1236976 RepID=W7YUL9_9BACL|nr:hypothetical protein [Paenibacillus pini]GAF10918.1 hypothetical protein JCM16418_5155 [Paenibacillus pini JCM 16418]
MHNKTWLSFILDRCWNALSEEDRDLFLVHIFDNLSAEKQMEFISELINKEDDSWGVIETIGKEEIEKYRQYIK